MKKKVMYLVLCCVIVFGFHTKSAFATPGPYVSLIFDFKGFEGEKYYLTLLSETESKYEEYKEGDEDFLVYQKFLSFADSDGFHFTNRFMLNPDNDYFFMEEHDLPQRFKILLYFPEYDSFAVSDKVYEQYAHQSYYNIDATDIDIQSAKQINVIKAKKHYNLTRELIVLSFKMIIIIGTKVFIALLFGFRKKELIIVALANAFALTVLSILVSIIRYNFGLLGFFMLYFILVMLLIIFESLVYSKYLAKYSGEEPIKGWQIVLYAFISNAITFFIGFNSFLHFIIRT